MLKGSTTRCPSCRSADAPRVHRDDLCRGLTALAQVGFLLPPAAPRAVGGSPVMRVICTLSGPPSWDVLVESCVRPAGRGLIAARSMRRQGRAVNC